MNLSAQQQGAMQIWASEDYYSHKPFRYVLYILPPPIRRCIKYIWSRMFIPWATIQKTQKGRGVWGRGSHSPWFQRKGIPKNPKSMTQTKKITIWPEILNIRTEFFKKISFSIQTEIFSDNWFRKSSQFLWISICKRVWERHMKGWIEVIWLKFIVCLCLSDQNLICKLFMLIT